jgi:hypothetical protein
MGRKIAIVGAGAVGGREETSVQEMDAYRLAVKFPVTA